MKKAVVKPKAVPDWAIYLVLCVATVAVYSQVHNFAFLELDDVQAIPGNPHVRDGFSWAAIVWAFSTGYAANWFPVTWMSHMLDCQLFGLDAGWHHLTNVLIHTVNSVLLFALMKRMTGLLWQSAFVAFVFALHPLHVESVAWVSERKDVLFAFFWFLSTWLYVDFVERRTIRNYLLMALAFCLGLMSKQMIVTLPFTLLLLDVWPLKRMRSLDPRPSGWRELQLAASASAGVRAGEFESGSPPFFREAIAKLILEKVPLIVLAIAASAITILVQRQGGAVQSLQEIPFTLRAANALISYIAYLTNFVWPLGLAAFYTYPFHLPAWKVVSAALLLAAISILAVVQFRIRPYLAVGWFWYLGTLAPVIGLIQVGYQSRADRYTYVPLIGISIMIAFAWPKKFAPAAAIVVCSFWLLMTWIQVGYWQDGVALHRHTIAVTDRNYRAHEDLGVELAKRGDYQQALRELYTSVEENPEQAHARNTLGAILFHLGRKEEAIEEYARGVQIDPQGAQLHLNLGNTLADVGKTDDAVRELNTAIRLQPGMAAAYFGLGRVLVMQKREPEAIRCFTEALRLDPGYPQAREQLDALRGFQ
jgi:tetratricopeptide (TPR) repeat protein